MDTQKQERQPLKFVEMTVYEVMRTRIHLHAIEITSFEQLSKLKRGKEVAIMDTCDMVYGTIDSLSKDYVWINTKKSSVMVSKDSFKYRNFMYEII